MSAERQAKSKVMRAVLLQHDEHEGPGRLEPALVAEGFTVVHRFRGVHREDVDADLVVALGGSMSVDAGDRHPFIVDERALFLERLALERPCLGLGLGAQLLAVAAGATVSRGKNGLEVGAHPVRWTKDGLADPVVAGVSPRTMVAHWHEDTWGPVPGATLLASTDRYTQQAFRLGRSYGFQFHPELDAAALAKRLALDADLLAADGKDVAALEAQLPKLKGAEAELGGLLERLAHHFARAAA